MRQRTARPGGARSPGVGAPVSGPPRVRPLRVGTRGSALALRQTDFVLELLAVRDPGIETTRVTIRTEGDVDKTSPLTVIGGRGVFTSALGEALARGEIDAAVHSAKDLPSESPPGLALVAFPDRADARDALISRHGLPLAELPARPTIGTSSRRRAVQVLAARPDARIVELRGNVDTRLRKARADDLDAIVLAAAGVGRMGWSERIVELLPLDRFVPSPGQGALAVEARVDDAATRRLLEGIDDHPVAAAVRIERAFLRAIGGGCTTPVGAYAAAVGSGWRLLAMLATEDGTRVEWADVRLDGETAAAELARSMLARLGGGPIRWAAGRNRATTLAPNVAPDGRGMASVMGPEPEPDGAPLLGLRVLVTRPRAQTALLMATLRALGAEPLALPTIRIEDAADPRPLERAAVRQVEGTYDWVVFTSVNAVDRWLAAVAALSPAATAAVMDRARIAAVGGATAARLREAGLPVALVPATATASGLAAALIAAGIGGARVLYPHGDLARDTLASDLRAAGATLEAVTAYRTLPEPAVDPAMRERVRRGEVDAVLFASPSSVRNLAALLGGREPFAPLRRAAIVAVGPVTARAAREHGLPVTAVAADASVAGLIAALAAAYGRDRTEDLDVVDGNDAMVHEPSNNGLVAAAVRWRPGGEGWP